MFTFEGPQDLMNEIRRMQERAETAAGDTSMLKREQEHNRSRAGAFAECLEYLVDYFNARPEQMDDRAWTDDGKYHAPKSFHPATCAGCTSDKSKHGKPVVR